MPLTVHLGSKGEVEGNVPSKNFQDNWNLPFQRAKLFQFFFIKMFYKIVEMRIGRDLRDHLYMPIPFSQGLFVILLPTCQAIVTSHNTSLGN